MRHYLTKHPSVISKTPLDTEPLSESAKVLNFRQRNIKFRNAFLSQSRDSSILRSREHVEKLPFHKCYEPYIDEARGFRDQEKTVFTPFSRNYCKKPKIGRM